MALINKQDIEKLINVQNNTNALCISFYLPTHRTGPQTLNGVDSTLFKNQIRKAKELLTAHDVPQAEIESYIKPAEELLHDNNFWRHQSDGLVVFITKGFSVHYNLPVTMPTEVYVLNQFYFTPILPILSQNGRFFVLHLFREQVTFYEATIDTIKEINISSMIPESIEEALQPETRGKDQDFQHSRTTINGSYINTAQAGTTKGDQEHGRVREFLQGVSNGLQEILHDAHEPLVLAGVDHYCAIYRAHSKYKNIVPQNINVNENSGVADSRELHEKALAVMKPIMEQSEKEAMERYNNVAGTGVTSEDVATVAAESMHGRIDTLFIKPGSPVWGTYDNVNATAEVHDNYRRGDFDLINLAAVKTISQGGRVFVSNNGEASEMGTNNTSIKALFRY
ncbi:baeRF3 domain-containing protein [Pontibacter akesuensis]|uniref:Uncharacterized protein n=1 Tax=Pontibacter akesuensis TaxID=388950 RepID=A0A1I7I2W5_9BACT|nr:hypothetical protein [Pontibacter akesuensis]GHA64913.1 hypothetical protein GCM10007389_17100 [Pontibacter akesuensis]SFU67254.1 hypothetical protein SAMN04487941_1871 [Pontibacter akesuensis]